MRNSSFNEAVDAISTQDELSLFHGGLFYRMQSLLHLNRMPNWKLPPLVIWIVSISWLPLLILTVMTHREHLYSLLRDYVVYSRIAIAAPVLIIGQLVMESRFRLLVKHLREAQLLSEKDLHNLNGMIGTLKRLRDSVLPEVIIVALIVAVTVIRRSRVTTGGTWAVLRNADAVHLTLAGWYYLLVSLPLYEFLLLLNLWKWVVWSFLLYRISRMHLDLVPTHPDEHGGLGFLGLTPAGFIPIAVALSTAIGGTWRYEILYSGATLASLTFPAIILLGVIFMCELGPLCFFVLRLTALRQRALLEYGVFAQPYAAEFHDKWIVRRGFQQKEIPNVTMLAHLAESYRNVKQMRPLPVDKGTLISLAIAVLLPLFPVVLAEIPLSVIVKGLIQAARAPI